MILIAPLNKLRLTAFVTAGLVAVAVACNAPTPRSPSSSEGSDPASSSENEAPIPLVAVELVPQIGHAVTVTAPTFSADGRRVVTCSADDTAKLWDPKTGELLATLSGFDDSTRAAYFTQSGEILVVGGTMVGRFSATGEAIFLKSVSHSEIREAAYRGQDELLALVTESGEVLTVDGKTGDGAKVLVREDRAQTKRYFVAFGSDGKSVETMSSNVYEKFDLESGLGQVLLSRFSSKPGYVPELGSDAIFGTIATVDALYFGTMQGTVFRFDRNTREVQSHDTKKGWIHSLVLGHDGSELLVGLSKGEVLTLDAQTLEVKQQRKLLSEDVSGIAQSSDGKWLLATGVSAEMVASGEGRRVEFPRTSGDRARRLSLSNDGHYVAVATTAGTLVWDLRRGILERQIPPSSPGHTAQSVAFSADGKFIAVGELGTGSNHPVLIIDRASGEILHSLLGHSREARRLEFLDAKTLASIALDGTLRLWDFEAEVEKERYSVSRASQAFYLDDSTVLMTTGAYVGTMQRGEGQRGEGAEPQYQKILTDLADVIYDAKMVGDSLVTVSADGYLTVTSMPSGQRVNQVKAHTGWARELYITKDRGRAFTLGQDGWVKEWRLSDLTLLAEYRDPKMGSGVGLAVADDEQNVVWVGTSGVGRWLNLKSGEHVSFFAQGDEWIVFNDKGYFDGSRGAGDLVRAVGPGRAYRVDQLAVSLNRPDLLLLPLAKIAPEEASDFERAYSRRLRHLGLAEKDVVTNFGAVPGLELQSVRKNGSQLDAALKATARRGSLKALHVYVNGVLANTQNLSGREASINVSTLLTPGDNVVEWSVTDSSGLESLRLSHAESLAPSQGELHFLAFGVSHYKDSRLTLRYPHKDVLDLKEVIKAMGPHFKKVNVHAFTNEAVTVASIENAKNLLRGAKPSDTLILFVAGHGAYTSGASAKYVYLTHETQISDLEHTAAPFSLFEELLAETKARQKLFLLDTCQSGEKDDVESSPLHLPDSTGINARALVLSDETPSSRATQPVKRALDRERMIYADLARRSGAVVFSSSRGAEVSFERDDIQNGVFTQALLDLFTEGEGNVDLDTMRKEVARKVAAATNGAQNPTVDRGNPLMKLSLPKVPAKKDVAVRRLDASVDR